MSQPELRQRPEDIVFRFDRELYCVVCCREDSDVVQMVSNLADKTVADMYADGIRNRGGHVFAVVPAGALVASLHLIKSEKSSACTDVTS